MARLFSAGDKIAGQTISSVEQSGGRLVINVGGENIMLPSSARLLGLKVEVSASQYEAVEKAVRLWAEKADAL